jgi:hypothetical protein
MGMASFVDRLRDLLNDAMHMRGDWETRTAVPVTVVMEPLPHDVQMQEYADNLQRRLDAFGPLLDSMIRQLNELLEYATDPTLQLVEEVHRLRIERDSLSGQLNHTSKERAAMRAYEKKAHSFAQDALFAKRVAEMAAAKLSKELMARNAALEREIRIIKVDLAAKQRSHERTVERLKQQHEAEIANLRAAHKVEMSNLMRRAEKANRPIPSEKQSRQDEFAELLSKSSPPRVSTQTMPVKKRDSANPKKKR